MGRLLEVWPSAGLTLFARYGVGSRDKLGFQPHQTLAAVLRQYLVFDPNPVLEVLWGVEQQQRQLRVDPARFSALRQIPGAYLVDCRSLEEYRSWSLPGAHFLEARLVEHLRQSPPRAPLLLFDHRGPMAGAAALHLQKLGLEPQVLNGGLRGWVEEIDDRLPHYGCDAPSGARIRQLPDRRQMRFRLPRASPQPQEGRPQVLPFDCLRLWWRGNELAVLAPDSTNWGTRLSSILEWLEEGRWEQHPWAPQPEPDWASRLPQVLREKVQPELESHRGSIELVGQQDGVVRLRLGGGCQGCSSAAITVGEEIARTLWEEIPEIWAIEDASDHQDPQARPHH